MDKNLYSDLEKSSYTEDRDYPTSNKRKLYVLNFTPFRLIAFVVSFFVVFIALFTLGFSLGSGKGNNSNAKYLSKDASGTLLMREDNTTLNSASVPVADGILLNDINSKPNETVSDMKTLREIGSSSIVTDNTEVDANTSVANYEEYTASLNRELESMNKNIKNQFDIKDAPSARTTQKPDDMYIQVPIPDSLPPVKTSSISKVTKTPYTSDVEDGSLYYIQVAVGYNKNFVQKESENLKKISAKTFVKEDKKDGTTMYKLKIGRFTSRTEAEKVLKEVRKLQAYKDSYIYTDNK